MGVCVAIKHDDHIEHYEDIAKAIQTDGAVQLTDTSDESTDVDGTIFGARDGRFRIFIKPPQDDAPVESFGDITYAMQMPSAGITLIADAPDQSTTETRYEVYGTILNIQAYEND